MRRKAARRSHVFCFGPRIWVPLPQAMRELSVPSHQALRLYDPHPQQRLPVPAEATSPTRQNSPLPSRAHSKASMAHFEMHVHDGTKSAPMQSFLRGEASKSRLPESSGLVARSATREHPSLAEHRPQLPAARELSARSYLPVFDIRHKSALHVWWWFASSHAHAFFHVSGYLSYHTQRFSDSDMHPSALAGPMGICPTRLRPKWWTAGPPCQAHRPRPCGRHGAKCTPQSGLRGARARALFHICRDGRFHR